MLAKISDLIDCIVHSLDFCGQNQINTIELKGSMVWSQRKLFMFWLI